jgi:hypothetical protein
VTLFHRSSRSLLFLSLINAFPLFPLLSIQIVHVAVGLYSYFVLSVRLVHRHVLLSAPHRALAEKEKKERAEKHRPCLCDLQILLIPI